MALGKVDGSHLLNTVSQVSHQMLVMGRGLSHTLTVCRTCFCPNTPFHRWVKDLKRPVQGVVCMGVRRGHGSLRVATPVDPIPNDVSTK